MNLRYSANMVQGCSKFSVYYVIFILMVIAEALGHLSKPGELKCVFSSSGLACTMDGEMVEITTVQHVSHDCMYQLQMDEFSPTLGQHCNSL